MRHILKIFCLVVFSTFFLSCSYYTKQGYHALSYTFGAKPIKKILKNENLSPRTRTFLDNVQSIKSFAFDSIGLKRNKNFSSLVKTDKEYLINAVIACQSDTFKPYLWCFPIVGCVPYKGYFVLKDAKKEANKISSKGNFDVSILRMEAFSMLGFLPDPLYSFMESYSIYELASLIIHEQTHATVYIKNDAAFNEQLASFVGVEGAFWYIRSIFGDTSLEYKNATIAHHDYKTYNQLLRSLHAKLDSLYKTDLTFEKTIEEKNIIIADFKNLVLQKYDSLFRGENYKGIEKIKINNGYLLSRMTYTQDLELFYAIYKKLDFNLHLTIQKLIAFSKTKKPKQSMKDFVKK